MMRRYVHRFGPSRGTRPVGSKPISRGRSVTGWLIVHENNGPGHAGVSRGT